MDNLVNKEFRKGNIYLLKMDCLLSKEKILLGNKYTCNNIKGNWKISRRIKVKEIY